MPMKANLHQSLHIYQSPIKFETRLFKMVNFVVKNNIVSHVTVFGMLFKKQQAIEKIGKKMLCIRVPAYDLNNIIKLSKGLNKIAQVITWSLNVFFIAIKCRPKIINCHSLPALPVCFFLSLFHHCKLIYEPHELETETESFSGATRQIFKIIEKVFAQRAACIISVSSKIARKYSESFPQKRIFVIHNAEPISYDCQKINKLKSKYKIKNSQLLFLYQGLFAKERSVHVLLEAFSSKEINHHILFVGFGPMKKQIQAVCKKNSRIHYLESIQPEKLAKITCQADIGFSLLPQDCLNNKYALPNKFFSYINNSIPMIVAKNTEMEKIVKKNKCGWSVSPSSPEVLKILKKINKKSLREKKVNVFSLKQKYNWEKEEKKLHRVYNLVCQQY